MGFVAWGWCARAKDAPEVLQLQKCWSRTGVLMEQRGLQGYLAKVPPQRCFASSAARTSDSKPG